MSNAVFAGDTSGSITIQAPAVAGTNTLTLPASTGTLALTSQISPVTRFKNRIINGDMRIDQRNAGASVTITNTSANTYTLDRWFCYGQQASKFSVQQNAGAVTPADGYSNYLGITSLSAYSVASGEVFVTGQHIEGLNVFDLGWGTATAKTVTLSAWVYSSLTGTFGGALQNSAQNRAYPFTYSISSANTWTQVSITVPGDTAGTWLTTNGVGVRIFFGLGCGSTVSGTAGSWGSTAYWSASGATSVVGTSGAKFYITGVQLEVGSAASAFEYIDYTTQLSQCQRYYEQSYPIGTVAGTSSVQGSSWFFVSSNNSGYLYGSIPFKVTKRSAPTMTFYSYAGTAGRASDGSVTDLAANSASINGQTNTSSCGVGNASGGTITPAGSNITMHWTSSAEL